LAPMALPAASQPIGFGYDRFDRFEPIRVDSVTINRSGPATNGINIVYHNQRVVAARTVVFDVDYRGVERQITDVGTFSQFAEINHTFDVFKGFGYEGPTPDHIAVVYVQFADGTVWQR
ncbi:MAG TPA: hypothetical protein VEJ20_02835, partial [Candidatus Eremiobacteraceae bacterium]|nr:hypothetical protein [Candidatus Eremiobacteraceae bacterium]